LTDQSMATQATEWRVTLSDIDLGAEETAAVLEVLRSRWLSMGARTLEFERAFSEHTETTHAVAVSSGTAALHLALLAVGVKSGDEVIVPALTFVATANAALYCGARPVFGDICGADTPLLDPDDVERKITSRTRAIVPVHYGGYSCDMDALRDLAERHAIHLIDDAAHAIGSTWKGHPVGSLAEAACFSFFANKNLVTGEGGMVATNDDDIAAFVRTNRSHGMTAASYDKHRGHAFTYDVVSTGYNYRLTEIESALGLVQLRKLERNNARRRELVQRYRDLLGEIDGLVLPFAGRDDESACHLFAVVLPESADRQRIQEGLKAAGIQSSIHYPSIPGFSAFRERYEANVPRVDEIAARLLTLPLHPLMSIEDVELVSKELRQFF